MSASRFVDFKSKIYQNSIELKVVNLYACGIPEKQMQPKAYARRADAKRANAGRVLARRADTKQTGYISTIRFALLVSFYLFTALFISWINSKKFKRAALASIFPRIPHVR